MTHPFQPTVTVRIKTTDKRERLHGRTGVIEKAIPTNKVYVFIKGEGRVILDTDNLEVVHGVETKKPMTDEDYLNREVHYRVDYDLPDLESLEKAEAYALSLAKNRPDLSFDFSSGGPAWNAYMIFKGTSEEDTKTAALKFIRYVKQFKDYRLFA